MFLDSLLRWSLHARNVDEKMSVGFCRGSRVEGRGSRVEGRGSRVEGNISRVEGRGSRVEGRGSRVTYRGSRVNCLLSHEKKLYD